MEITNERSLSQDSVTSDNWVVLGKVLPKAEVVYFCQMIVLFTVILTAIINLSLVNSSETWLILLSTSLGAVLPSPKLKHVVKLTATRDINEQTT